MATKQDFQDAGEAQELLDKALKMIDEIKYMTSPEWKAACKGSGYGPPYSHPLSWVHIDVHFSTSTGRGITEYKLPVKVTPEFGAKILKSMMGTLRSRRNAAVAKTRT